MSLYVLSGDSPTNSRIAETLRKETGAAPVVCREGAELLEFLKLRREQPESSFLIVGDDLPDMSPAELISEARENDETLRIIALLERGSEDASELISADLADDIVFRPLNVDELIFRVRGLRKTEMRESRVKTLESEINKIMTDSEAAGARMDRDQLTGLSNSRRAVRFFRREWRRCLRYDWPLAVILVDIDFIDEYRMMKSMDKGDKRIVQLGKLLNESVKRPGDLSSRLRDARFSIILSETDEDGARHVAERLLRRVRNLKSPMTGRSSGEHMTISIGIRPARPIEYYRSKRLSGDAHHDSVFEEFLGDAERALKAAQSRGGDMALSTVEAAVG